MKLLFELLLATWLFGLAQSSSSAGSRTVGTGGRGSIPPLDFGRIISNPVATKGILLLIVLPDFQTFYRLWKVCTRNRYCYLLTHNILTKFSEDICHWLVAIQTFSFSNPTYQNSSISMKIKNINTGKSYCGGILQLLCHNSVPILTLKSFTCEFEIFRIFICSKILLELARLCRSRTDRIFRKF